LIVKHSFYQFAHFVMFTRKILLFQGYDSHQLSFIIFWRTDCLQNRIFIITNMCAFMLVVQLRLWLRFIIKG